ncbi:MAG: hypothetical protein WC887_02300 [Candidatus Paceibacterota bacterium]|jgi:hypothetical protein
MKKKLIQFIPALLALMTVGFRYFSNWCIFTTGVCYGTTISHISLTITKPLYNFSLYLLPILIILVFIPRHIFNSWLKFVTWSIPLAIIFIAFTPVSFTGLGIDFFPFYRDDAARLAGEVFSGISLILIIWKFIASRHKSGQV